MEMKPRLISEYFVRFVRKMIDYVHGNFFGKYRFKVDCVWQTIFRNKLIKFSNFKNILIASLAFVFDYGLIVIWV